MTKQGIAGIDRKCRSCGQWSFFKVDADSRRCSFCGADYGRIEMGRDVTRFATPKPKLPKDLRVQAPAMKVDKPKRGEYRGG